MKKLYIIGLMFIILFSSLVSAVCTVNFDKTSYFYGESVAASMVCDEGTESNKAYTLDWRDETGTIIETDTGVTPSGIGILFVESYNIPLGSSITNINATLTGTNLEGFDSATVSISTNQTLIITNITSIENQLIGKVFSKKFKLINGGNKEVSNAVCSLSISDNLAGTPIISSKEEVVINGEGHIEFVLSNKVFEEGRSYVSEISCLCVADTEKRCFNEDLENLGNRVTTSSTDFIIGEWIAEVSTLTDKTSYTLSDKYIDVCVSLNNTNDFRIPVDIYYSYRCGGGNNATDRVLIDKHRQYRGISGNTTQNQCARLKIINVPEIQNKVNNCYASTDVGVVFGDTSGIFPVTYSTTSGMFTITSTSGTFVDDTKGDKMVGNGIIWFLIILNLVLFILPLKVRFNPVEKFNVVWKYIVWALAWIILTFNVTIFATLAEVAGLGITSELLTFQWILMIFIYPGAVFLFWKAVKSYIEEAKIEKINKRMGKDDKA